MKTSRILLLFSSVLLISITLLQSCGEDNTSTNNGGEVQTTVVGSWSVESAHMVQAPSGSGPSQIMKQQLMPFGLMPAASVGYADVIFTDSTWSLAGNITNSVIRVICSANDSIYTANGTYAINSDLITFVVQHYSGPSGSQNIGSGRFTLTDKLTINLELANNEKWKITLRR